MASSSLGPYWGPLVSPGTFRGRPPRPPARRGLADLGQQLAWQEKPAKNIVFLFVFTWVFPCLGTTGLQVQANLPLNFQPVAGARRPPDIEQRSGTITMIIIITIISMMIIIIIIIIIIIAKEKGKKN